MNKVDAAIARLNELGRTDMADDVRLLQAAALSARRALERVLPQAQGALVIMDIKDAIFMLDCTAKDPSGADNPWRGCGPDLRIPDALLRKQPETGKLPCRHCGAGYKP